MHSIASIGIGAVVSVVVGKIEDAGVDDVVERAAGVAVVGGFFVKWGMG